MSQRSAGVFCIHPAVLPRMYQIKAGVTSLQTLVLHLAAFTPTSPLCVTSSGCAAVAAQCDLHSRKTSPPSSASCVRVRKCLSKEAVGLCIIYLWAGRRLAVFSAVTSPPERGSRFLPRPRLCGEIPYSKRVCADCLRVCCLRPTVQVNWWLPKCP